ncbi:unnamed protein product [Calypogeia fissa]
MPQHSGSSAVPPNAVPPVNQTARFGSAAQYSEQRNRAARAVGVTQATGQTGHYRGVGGNARQRRAAKFAECNVKKSGVMVGPRIPANPGLWQPRADK